MTLESELIAWLRKNLRGSPRLAIGLGDDAAELRDLVGSRAILTTDTVTDQVDFILAEIDPRQAGHKALAVNLSDLAAMAAQPVAVLVSLVLPKQNAFELACDLYRGIIPLAEKFDTVIAGGDTNTWDGPLAISVTAIGEPTARGPLTRSGAQPGDALLVTGQLGGSILGRHLAVEPRIEEALKLHQRYELHAGIDISDGLSIDASRLAAESKVGVALSLDAIPVSDAAQQLSRQTGRSALDHALGDGEDFELLLAVPPQEAERILSEKPLEIPVTKIGELTAEPGLWQSAGDGTHKPLAVQGYQHEGDT